MASILHLLTRGLLITILSTATASGQIENAMCLSSQPTQYSRVDFVVMLKAVWLDPFASDDIKLDLELASPSGARILLPAYFERGESEATSVWMARFTPREVGVYKGRFVLVKRGSELSSASVMFTVGPSSGRGFLQLASPWTLRFDNGEIFRGIGQNLGWEARALDDSRYFKDLHENSRYNYEYLLGTLSAHRGNFFRTWMCAWNLPLEWKTVRDTARYSNDSGHFNRSAIQRMDQLVDLAASTDTYFMLALDPHGSLLDAGWENNNYNARNGGPAKSPAEFFTSSEARIQYKDRLRYLIARWGFRGCCPNGYSQHRSIDVAKVRLHPRANARK